MRRIAHLLGRESGGLHGAAVLLGGTTFLSQLLGLVRDRLLAGAFGAGEVLDLYYAAFRVPDFLFIAIGSLLVATVLVPILTGLLTEGNQEQVRRFLSSMLTVFTAFFLVAIVAVFFAMPALARQVAPGFSQTQTEVLIELSRILLLSPFFLGLSNLFGSLVQARRQFLLYSISPILYNLGIISGIVLFYPIFGVFGLIYGVILGALLHFLLQFLGVINNVERNPASIIIRGIGFLSFRAIDWQTIRLVMSRSFPRAMAMAANQLSLFILVAYASRLASGSIAIFNLSYNLQSVPLALIGVSYSVAAFPTMVGRIKNGRDDALLFIRQVLSRVLFLSLPVTALFIILRREIVITVLGAGKFGAPAVEITAMALAIFAVSVVFQGVVLIFDRSYYAAGKTLVPVVTNLIGAAITIGSGFLLLRNFPTILMLPLAFGIGYFMNLVLEWVLFRRDFGVVFDTAFRHAFGKVVIAVISMGAVAHVILGAIGEYATVQSSLDAFLHGALAGLSGVLVGILALFLLTNLHKTN